MPTYLTIDVGGTHIKYALMQETGELTQSGHLPTPAKSLDQFFESIFSIIDQYQEEIEGVAFSVPGKVDSQTGTIYFGGALTYLDQVCLKDVIRERYGLRASVQNDGKAAALAELWLGSLQSVQDAAVIVLGTGVGGGIILDGKLRLGSHFQAGELSLSILDASQPGFRKMSGLLGSAVYMSSQVNKAVGYEDVKDGRAAFEAIQAGHQAALDIFQAYCRKLVYLIVNLQAFYDLTHYAIGGGISAQAILIEEIKRQFQLFLEEELVIKMNLPDITIIPAKFGNDANLYGALYTLLEEKD